MGSRGRAKRNLDGPMGREALRRFPVGFWGCRPLSAERQRERALVREHLGARDHHDAVDPVGEVLAKSGFEQLATIVGMRNPTNAIAAVTQ